MIFIIDDFFMDNVADYKVPVSFLLDGIIKEPGLQAFLKVNYDCGIRKDIVFLLAKRGINKGFLTKNDIKCYVTFFKQIP